MDLHLAAATICFGVNNIWVFSRDDELKMIEFVRKPSRSVFLWFIERTLLHYWWRHLRETEGRYGVKNARTDERTANIGLYLGRVWHVWTWIRDTMDQSTVYDASHSGVAAIDDLWFSLPPPHLLFGDVAVELKAVIAVWPPLTLVASSPPLWSNRPPPGSRANRSGLPEKPDPVLNGRTRSGSQSIRRCEYRRYW